MSPELIMLIVSIGTNVLVIFKRIKICWSPCLILQCRNEETEIDSPPENSFITKMIKKVTPRKKSENNNPDT